MELSTVIRGVLGVLGAIGLFVFVYNKVEDHFTQDIKIKDEQAKLVKFQKSDNLRKAFAKKNREHKETGGEAKKANGGDASMATRRERLIERLRKAKEQISFH